MRHSPDAGYFLSCRPLLQQAYPLVGDQHKAFKGGADAASYKLMAVYSRIGPQVQSTA
jgi:hypothetical protein